MRSDPAPTYRERLWVPLRWWGFALVFVAAVWLIYQHAYGPRVSVPAAVAAGAVTMSLLIGYGRVRVEVDASSLIAGRARLPMWAVGTIEELDPAAAKAARGADAHPRAYLLLRGYVPTAVRVSVDDADDPVPYWYVSTRRPQQLAAALEAARSTRRTE